MTGEIGVTQHVDRNHRLCDGLGQFDEQSARVVCAGVVDQQSDLDVVGDGTDMIQNLRMTEVGGHNAYFCIAGAQLLCQFVERCLLSRHEHQLEAVGCELARESSAD